MPSFININVVAAGWESSITSLKCSLVKSKKAEMKTMTDKKNFVLGVLHNVPISRLRLKYSGQVLGLYNIFIYLNMLPS